MTLSWKFIRQVNRIAPFMNEVALNGFPEGLFSHRLWEEFVILFNEQLNGNVNFNVVSAI